ncbi:hypothetical protein NIES2119_13955 [[Phormidium ambiguum] IAM M-71]|uniref:DUF1822 domain-containing protein n=1 Tax=[Phormidium ambiguum] IAM M-71 TaxID=454136 RepID=A0A1U7IJH2_9CYAN|nr:DUF1822 family protein [Phormidium ambiguum]OKH37348.1 hypothetical protein NIES2119_13955 [Phormidium ambiguum IAM M-71]
MIPSIKHILENAIPLPITTASMQIAQQFANQQLTPEKQTQVYLNTLAIGAVNDYMQMMDISVDLKDSDSWNSAIRLYADVADLTLTGLGKLECRPVKVDDLQKLTYYLPPEVPEDRIGVVVVAIDDGDRQATLLGFAKTVTTGNLPISQLQTLDDLLVYLEYLTVSQSQIPNPKSQIQLSQWLQNTFVAGWQSVETLLNLESGNSLEFGWRKQPSEKTTIKGAKLIDLGVQLGHQCVALLVAISPETDERVKIRVQLHPGSGETYLPANLKLILLDETGEIIQEIPSRSFDNFIQLPHFIGSVGEQFGIQISLETFTLKEDFII